MIAELILFVTLILATSAYSKAHLQRDRRYDNHDKEIRSEIKQKADSLMDTWLEAQMKIDTFKLADETNRDSAKVFRP
jgi:hypothetical protein